MYDTPEVKAKLEGHNIVASSVYDMSGGNRSQGTYDTLYTLAIRSAKRFVRGPFKIVKFINNEQCNCTSNIFKSMMRKVMTLNVEYRCNILLLDADTVIVDDVNVFGSYDRFTMFSGVESNRFNEFDYYFNSGVRYYPNTMLPSTWDIAREAMTKWEEYWDFEQYISNMMFYAENKDRCGRNGLLIAQKEMNSSPITGMHPQPKIIHFHATRPGDVVAKVMEYFDEEKSPKLEDIEIIEF